MKIGFIGQGWIGKHFADDFEQRGYEVIRYGLEQPFTQNRLKIADCDITFIAVPTPTTPDGFDISIVRSVLSLIGEGKNAVIKSTILPGTTALLQNEFPDIYIFHSPEFLVEKTAAFDAAHPNRNIIGVPEHTNEHYDRARDILSVLPQAPYAKVMDAKDAEFVKYAGNCFLYMKVIYMNILYDLVTQMGGDWNNVRDGFIHDPRIGTSHTEPVHSTGRGAGGHCLIKDFEAFRNIVDSIINDSASSNIVKAMAYKNIQLLTNTNKDTDLLRGVYGDIDRFRVWRPLSEIDL